MPGITKFPRVVRDAVDDFGDLFVCEPKRRHFAEYLTGLLVAARDIPPFFSPNRLALAPSAPAQGYLEPRRPERLWLTLPAVAVIVGLPIPAGAAST